MFLLAASFLALVGQRANAATVEFASIEPATAQLVPEDSQEPSDAPENASPFQFYYEGDPGESYTVTFTSDESPVMIIAMGADMTTDNNWSYDEATGTVTVNLTSVEFLVDKGTAPVFVVVVVFPVGLDEDGPPEQMTGAWMATNVGDWELIPPSPDQIGFGFVLSGPEGEEGFFRMYVPDALIDLLGQFRGEDLAIKDLAVFVGDDQASLAVEDIGTGALINIELTFTDNVTDVSEVQATSSSLVEKRIVAQEKLSVSLAANKYSVKKGKKANLFGWVKNEKKGEAVTIWRKLKGEKSYTKITKLQTKKAGYYSYEIEVETTATYKVKWNKKTSSTRKITVN